MKIDRQIIVGGISGALVSAILLFGFTGPYFGVADAYWACFHSSTPTAIIITIGLVTGVVAGFIISKVK